MPTLVIHGLADRMCDVSGGRATADAIPGAELVLIEGMGHDLPRALWPLLATSIANFVLGAGTAESGCKAESGRSQTPATQDGLGRFPICDLIR